MESGDIFWIVIGIIFIGSIVFQDKSYIFFLIVGIIVIIILAIKFIAKQSKEDEENREAANRRIFEEYTRQQRQQREELARQQQQKAEELASQQRHREEQVEYGRQIVAFNEQSFTLYETAPKYLIWAEQLLDRAEIDFNDHVYSPFWDSIESVNKELANFNASIREINDISSRYIQLIKMYEGTPPEFSLTHQLVLKLGVGTETAKRMHIIVRRAQSDPNFAMIYEQRKTNKILIKGFANLAGALAEMTNQITSSIYELTSSVDGLNSSVYENTQEIYSQMDSSTEIIVHQHGELLSEVSGLAERQKKAVEMLDNIQRGRKP